MKSTIFSAIPIGVSVRRLAGKMPQTKGFKFAAYETNTVKGRIGYGRTIRSAVNNLGKKIETVIQ